MKSISIFFLLFLFNFNLFSQAPNDDCVDRITISVLSGSSSSYSFDSSTATESINASCDTAGNNNLDVWYEFTMPVNGNVRINGIPNTVSASIFDSCGGTELACFYDDGFFYSLTSGTVYVLRISERDLFAGNINFNIEAFETAPNDECINRTTIAVVTGGANTYSTDSRTATESIDASCDTAANINLDVWYQFTMPVNGNVRITGIPNTVSASIFDVCGGTELACFNDDGFFYSLTSGTTYILRISERSLFAGTINFNIEAFVTAPNDECVNKTSIAVTTGGANTYTIDSRATSESMDASCDNASYNNLDAWYDFDMPVNGNVRITGIPNTVSASIFDSCGGTELACFIDDGFFYNLTSGTTYVLRISERSLFAGNINFNIEAFETALNDECIDRTTIAVTTGGANTYNIDSRTATESMDVSCDNASYNNLDVWYEFTMPVNGNVRITGIDSVIGASLFDNCGGTELDCFFNSGFFYNLTSGNTYTLRISERDIFAGNITFNIEAFETAPNDECTNKIPITVATGGANTYNTDSRTASESMDASCDNASYYNLDVWYEFTMPVNGNVRITGIDSVIGASLFDNCGGTELDCFFNSGFFYNLTSGNTYTLRISERDIFAGNITFNIEAFEAAPNDECIDAIEMSVSAFNPTTYIVESRGATESLDASCENASYTNLDVWYEFVMPLTGKVVISNSDSLTYMTFYDACGGTELACFNGNNNYSGITAGTQLYLKVSKRDVFANNFDFSIKVECLETTTQFIAGAWDNGVPNASKVAIISDDYNTSDVGLGSLTTCECLIETGTTFTVAQGDYLEVNFNATVDGTLQIEHEGSFVQNFDNGKVTNNGTINVIKTTPVNTGNSFSILGSPMSGTTRGGAFVDNNVVMYHQTAQFNLDPDVTAVNSGAEHFADVEGDNWQFISAANGSTQVFAPEGYLVGPTTQGVIDNQYDLIYNEGTLNNGVYTQNVIYNLVGTAAENKSNSPNILSNPYASAIDADALITNNAVIDEIYFWEHLSPPNAGYPGYRSENWDMGDISIRNIGGGIPAPNAGVIQPSQYIPSGQGFAIKANAAGTVTFNNSLRVTGNNTDYRNSETERMYLKISNETYALKSSTLVAFTNGATNGYEAMYDAKRLATPISIYSVLDERELAIQGRSVFTTEQVIPLGFRTMVEEEQTYTISLGNIEGENITQTTVYLEDNLLGTITNLSEGSYTFTSNESNQKDRFVIVFVDEQLGNNDNNLEAVSIYPNPTQNVLNIVSPLSTISKVEVFDIRGRMIQTEKVESQSSFQLEMNSLESAMYFVKVTTDSGTLTKRIIRE